MVSWSPVGSSLVFVAEDNNLYYRKDQFQILYLKIFHQSFKSKRLLVRRIIYRTKNITVSADTGCLLSPKLKKRSCTVCKCWLLFLLSSKPNISFSASEFWHFTVLLVIYLRCPPLNNADVRDTLCTRLITAHAPHRQVYCDQMTTYRFATAKECRLSSSPHFLWTQPSIPPPGNSENNIMNGTGRLGRQVDGHQRVPAAL